MKNLAPDFDEMTDESLEASWSTDAGMHPAATHAGANAAAQRYDMVDASDMHDDPVLLAAWREMLARGNGPEKLYQTPEFFRYMVQGEQGQVRSHALYAVRRRTDGAYVGMVPVRKSEQSLAFGPGPLQLLRRRLPVLQVLGSVPLLDRNEPGLAGHVLAGLLQRHPDCPALSMQAVPEGQVAALDTLDGLSAHLHNGLRDCHTVPLPEHFDAYLQKFSSKKRYNLSRQVRLLGEQAGQVQVLRIEEPVQVPVLVEAMRAVLTAQQFAQLGPLGRLERLAQHGLLHSYVIRCGAEDVAFVVGTRSAEVWHVHNIAALAKYHALSAGTSAVHLALQDAITHFSFSDADFGYGTPNQDFRSTHVLKARGAVLLCRSRSATACLLAVHGVVQRATDAVAARIKEAQRKLEQRRRAARKPAANA